MRSHQRMPRFIGRGNYKGDEERKRIVESGENVSDYSSVVRLPLTRSFGRVNLNDEKNLLISWERFLFAGVTITLTRYIRFPTTYNLVIFLKMPLMDATLISRPEYPLRLIFVSLSNLESFSKSKALRAKSKANSA